MRENQFKEQKKCETKFFSFVFKRNGNDHSGNDLNNLYMNGNGSTPGVSDMPTPVEKDILV